MVLQSVLQQVAPHDPLPHWEGRAPQIPHAYASGLPPLRFSASLAPSRASCALPPPTAHHPLPQPPAPWRHENRIQRFENQRAPLLPLPLSNQRTESLSVLQLHVANSSYLKVNAG